MNRLCLSLLLFTTACSTAVSSDDPFEARDPIRPVNEKIFAFNVGADKYVIGPTAHAYHTLPGWTRSGVSNFLSNLGEPLNAIDGVLAAEPNVAFTSIWRFLLNSSFGLLGFRDFAGENGLKAVDWDFGKTLGRYGIGDGPYVVLPLLGPSTARDATGQLVDSLVDPVDSYLDEPEQLSRTGGKAITKRDQNDGVVQQLYFDSLDPYVATRSAYLQNQAFGKKVDPAPHSLAPKDTP